MAQPRLTVVLSQAQGKHPVKQALEESILAALIMEPGVEVSVVPYLYDIDAKHTARLFLESITGDMVVLSWIFPRAAFWTLDRDGIKGHYGESLLKQADEDDEEEDVEEEKESQGIGALDVPDRMIFCVDLRNASKHEVFVEEVRRIAAECRQKRANQPASANNGNGNAAIVDLGLNFLKTTSSNGNGHASQFNQEELLKTPERRWYPVIDYSRCTNCMECIDFCLFGVYGLDDQERILVENQDQCRKGCPACSRVCPEQAIIFPNHKTPAIAGAPVGAIGALKIDLSKLFGGDIKDAISQAVSERDEPLAAGREAVGHSVGIPKRQADKDQGPKDDLDNLMDALDELDI